MTDAATLAPEAPGIPPCPDQSLWPFLDAAVRCIARFGWSRTSVKDVATEAGVERTTVYRRVGSMDDVLRLLVAREVHLLVAALPDSAPVGTDGPDLVVEVLASAIEQTRDHAVFSKVLRDEPEVPVAYAVQGLPGLVHRIASAIEPLLALSMERGVIARRDPATLASWIARIGLSLLLLPPDGDLRGFLREILDPVLRREPPAREQHGTAPSTGGERQQ